MAKKGAITWENLVSSNLSRCGWDEDNQVLIVEFIKGGVYEYDGADYGTFENLRDAASPGGYFAQNIKGQFSSRKIS